MPVATKNSSAPLTRSRYLYLAATLAVMGIGLLWRKSGIIPPGSLSKFGGDALWALMLFLGLSMLSPRSSTRSIATAAVLVSFAVETSQLYHAPWIDAFRQTSLGALTIGSVFHWPDFAAYLVGIGIGVAGEGLRRIR